MSNTSYRLIKFGEYIHEGLWLSSELFESYDKVYQSYTKVLCDLSTDPTLKGAAVIRTDDEKDFWFIEDSVGLGGLYLYKLNDPYHIGSLDNLPSYLQSSTTV